MHPDSSRSDAPPNCFVNPLGPGTVLERVHSGTIFEVFRVRVGDRDYAVKSPRRERPAPAKAWFPKSFSPKWFGAAVPSERPWDLPVEAGCWSASAFMRSVSGDPIGFVRPAQCTPDDWAWLGFALLGAESEHLRRTQGQWNHEVVALGLWDGGDRAYTDSKQPSRTWSERYRPALVMPWHDGDDLGALSREQQRALFPRMLPALWDALLVAPHGDLSPSNLRLLRDRHKFVLLDPGVHLRSPGKSPSPCSIDELDMFVTNLQTYPVLPYGVDLMHVGDALSAFITGITTSRFDALTRWFPKMSSYALGAPSLSVPRSSDWLAVGIMYFVILSGQHPFYRNGFDAPAWAGARTTMLTWSTHPRSIVNDPELPRWAERCRDMLASTKDLEDAERRLAIELLSLSFSTRDQLIDALVRLSPR